jgi:hypothetical protein
MRSEAGEGDRDAATLSSQLTGEYGLGSFVGEIWQIWMVCRRCGSIAIGTSTNEHETDAAPRSCLTCDVPSCHVQKDASRRANLARRFALASSPGVSTLCELMAAFT